MTDEAPPSARPSSWWREDLAVLDSAENRPNVLLGIRLRFIVVGVGWLLTLGAFVAGFLPNARTIFVLATLAVGTGLLMREALQRRRWVSGTIGLAFTVDLWVIAAVVHYSGGLDSPFIAFFFFQILVASYFIPFRINVVLSLLQGGTLLVMAALESARWLPSYPEPIEAVRLSMPVYWATVAAGIAFLSGAVAYVGRGFLEGMRRHESSLRRRAQEMEGLARENARLLAEVEASYRRAQTSQNQVLHQEKLATIGQMAAGVAHEINNPLTVLLTHTELLAAKTANPSDQHDKLRIILEAGQRIQNLSRNLLAFARPAREERRFVTLNSVVDQALSFSEYELKRGGIEIVRDLASELPSIVGIPDQLQQVVLNLLSNAKQSMVGRSGEIRVATRSGADGLVELSVTDQGVGIPQENLERIFEPFFTTRKEGTGLGLSIVMNVVERHGGRIRVESEIGRGSTFSVILPTAG